MIFSSVQFVHETQDIHGIYLTPEGQSSDDRSEDDDTRHSASPTTTPAIALPCSHKNVEAAAGGGTQNGPIAPITTHQWTAVARFSRALYTQDTADFVPLEPRPVLAGAIWPINDYVKLRLLSFYLQKTSRWLESTDSKLHFSSQTGHLVKDSQLLAAAAVTLGSTQYMPDGEDSVWLGDQLYKFSVSLRSTSLEQKRESTIAALIIGVYLTSIGKISSCLQNLRYCADLLKGYDVDPSFPELPSACFWTFARLGR
jgi:hypothetical protein